MSRICTPIATLLLGLSIVATSSAAEPLKLLFLGDNGHHQPAAVTEPAGGELEILSWTPATSDPDVESGGDRGELGGCVHRVPP